jgi:ABC-type nitrate/sulfonate/bicarbonate transport system permease component
MTTTLPHPAEVSAHALRVDHRLVAGILVAAVAALLAFVVAVVVTVSLGGTPGSEPTGPAIAPGQVIAPDPVLLPSPRPAGT